MREIDTFAPCDTDVLKTYSFNKFLIVFKMPFRAILPSSDVNDRAYAYLEAKCATESMTAVTEATKLKIA